MHVYLSASKAGHFRIPQSTKFTQFILVLANEDNTNKRNIKRKIIIGNLLTMSPVPLHSVSLSFANFLL